jgi:hypothetical protein
VRMRKSRPVLQEAAALLPWTALVLPTPVLTANETEHQTTAPIEHLVVIIEEKVSLPPIRRRISLRTESRRGTAVPCLARKPIILRAAPSRSL